MTEIERALDEVDWTAHGADPVCVSAAMGRLLQARSRVEARNAYNEVLDTIGHNHSGWLYDAAGPAAALIAAIARDNEGWTRWAALEILIDCLAWVRPDQLFTDASGHRRSVREALHESAGSLRALLRQLAAGSTGDDPSATSAADLLEALEETDTV